MRRGLVGVAVTIGAVVMAAGCVQVKEELVLQADGSGTYSAQYAFNEQMTAMVDMAKSFEKMAPKGEAEGEAKQESPGQPEIQSSLPMTAEDVRKMLERPGLEVKDVKEEKKDGKQTVSFNVAFKDVRELFKTEMFESKKPALEINDRGELVLRMATEDMGGGPAETPSPEMTDEMKAALVEQQKMAMAMMEPMLKDFKAEFSVVMPNDVTSGNAHTKEGRKATWVYDYAKLKEMGAFEGKAGKDNVLSVTCSAEGVTLPAANPSENPSPGEPATTPEQLEVIADSQLQAGDNFLAAGMKDKALEAYKEIVEKYPGTKAAPKARAKIAELGSGQ